MPGAVQGNGQDDVRVNSAHSRVDQFELRVWELLTQHHFQHAPEAERRLGQTRRCRLTQDENPKRARAFGGREKDWLGNDSGFVMKE